MNVQSFIRNTITNKPRVVVSTIYLNAKFPGNNVQVGMLRVDQKLAWKCYFPCLGDTISDLVEKCSEG